MFLGTEVSHSFEKNFAVYVNARNNRCVRNYYSCENVVSGRWQCCWQRNTHGSIDIFYTRYACGISNIRITYEGHRWAKANVIKIGVSSWQPLATFVKMPKNLEVKLCSPYHRLIRSVLFFCRRMPMRCMSFNVALWESWFLKKSPCLIFVWVVVRVLVKIIKA
jgi:hypothetical protein